MQMEAQHGDTFLRGMSPSPSMPQRSPSPFGEQNTNVVLPRPIFAPSSSLCGPLGGRGGSTGGGVEGLLTSTMGSSLYHRSPSMAVDGTSAASAMASAGPRWRPRMNNETARQPSLPSHQHNHHRQHHERWHPTMTHVPTRVLDAPGMVDDAYSQCLSWGRHRMAAILESQMLLFDVSNPGLFTGFKHTEDDDAEAVGLGGVTTLPKSRLSAVAVSARTDEECLVGDSRGRVRILADRGDQSEAVVTRTISLESDIGAVLAGDHHQEDNHPIQRLHASALTMHMPLLFDMATRSVSSIDAIDRHPFLYLVGTAAGSTIVLDTRIGGRGVIAARAHGEALCGGWGQRPRPLSPGHRVPSATAYPSPSNVVPYLEDRVVAVSWNCSGSLMAAGTNANGVAVWSLANMSEPVHRIAVGSPSGHGCSTSSSGPGDRRTPSTPSSAAVRALCFHPTDPFELAYGGGLGDGTLCLTNVATSERLYQAATGAQITQLRYSPCGTMLVSAHGLRKADMPRVSASVGANANAAMEWGGAPDGPCSRRKNCIAVWSRGRTKATPSSVLARAVSAAQSDAFAGGFNSDAYGSRRGVSAMMTRSSSRDSITSDSSSVTSDADSVDSMSGYGGFDADGWGAVADRDDAGQALQGGGPRPLQLRVRLDGHTTRPLHMAAPRDGPHLGGVATAAGGADSTIRNWDIFTRTRRGTTASGRSSVFTTTPHTAATSPSHDAPSDAGAAQEVAGPPRTDGGEPASYRSSTLPQRQHAPLEYSSMDTASLR